MPPRYAYWTIIADGLPTAFRAADKEDLLPTFARIKQKHPDAQMKWFARGKLWESPESARHDREMQRSGDRVVRDRNERRGPGHPRDGQPPRPSGGTWGNRPPGAARGRDWRPGGEHRDPRQKFKDAKKARNVEERRRKFERRERFEHKGNEARARQREPQSPSGSRPLPPQGGQRPPDRPRAPHQKWGGERGPYRDAARPSGGSRPPKQSWSGPKPPGPKPEWRERRRFEQKTFGRNHGKGEPKTPMRPVEPPAPPPERRQRARPDPRRRGR